MTNPDKKRSEEITVYWTRAQPAVASFISLMVPNFQDSSDVLQEVAIAIVKKFDDYDREYPFVAWAIGVAKNEILNYRRKYSKDRHIFDTETVHRIAEVYEKEAPMIDEIKKALEVCLKRVQGRWRQIMEMRYLRELSISRIAQQLGMTKNAVYITLHRVRLALRECVDRQLSKGETV
jgi:RNA polymerase sigma-70 factor (ECF subfamily)